MRPTAHSKIEFYRRQRIKRRIISAIAGVVVCTIVYVVYKRMQYRYGPVESPSSSQAQDATLSR